MRKHPVSSAQRYLRELLLLQVLRHRRTEVFGVTFVQAVDLSSLLDLHVPVHQDELSERLRSRDRRPSLSTGAVGLTEPGGNGPGPA